MTRDARSAILLSVALLGCSSEPSRYAATGTVTMDGAPAPLVVVKFLPASPGSSPGGSGTTDGAGKFTIGEDGKNTGLPSGEYKVTFSQTLVNGKPTLAGSGGKKAREGRRARRRPSRTTTATPRRPRSPRPSAAAPTTSPSTSRPRSKLVFSPSSPEVTSMNRRRAFHPDRAAGRDRDHRGPDRPAAAGRPGRPRGRPRARSAPTT